MELAQARRLIFDPLRSFQFRESAIRTKDGPFPEVLDFRIAEAIKRGDLGEAYLAVDQWRFSRLSPEAQLQEQTAHR